MKVQAEVRNTLENLSSNGDTLRSLANQITKGNGVTSFIGAGMSVPLGYMGWGDFLLEISEKFGVKSSVTTQIKSGQVRGSRRNVLRRQRYRGIPRGHVEGVRAKPD